MNFWFWNIDLENQSYFKEELQEGRLRQGWGYDEKLNLEKIKHKIDNNIELDEEETATWSRCNVMLEYIKIGDVVVVKNIPNKDNFSLVKVVGAYQFDIDDIGDYGHYLPINLVRVVNKYSSIVNAEFVNALNRSRWPIIITYKHAENIKNLLLGDINEEEIIKPEEFKEKFARGRNSLIPHLKTYFKQNLFPPEAERLILLMLQRDRLNVDWIAGSNERGADLLSEAKLGYGLSTRIAIQVKMHWDIDNDVTGINQIEWAFAEHNAQAGLLVTFADELGIDLKNRINEAKQKYNIEVLFGDELYSRLLELMADQNIEI